MSTREHRRVLHRRHRLCAACQERKAKFQYQGTIRADRDHVLCFQCFRAERERQRARQLVLFPHTAPETTVVTPSGLEHRRRMLQHLEAQAASVAGRRR